VSSSGAPRKIEGMNEMNVCAMAIETITITRAVVGTVEKEDNNDMRITLIKLV